MVKEIYVTNGTIQGSKFVLNVNTDGTVELNWYLGLTKIEEKEPTINKKHNGSMMIEYGTSNLMGIRPNMPFTNDKGVLDPRWTRIK